MNTSVIVSLILAIIVVAGIAMMSKPQTAKRGNLLSALAMLAGIIFTLVSEKLNGTAIASAWVIYPSLVIGALLGGLLAMRVRMIQMPQMVALLNGLGGGASALVGILSVSSIGNNVVDAQYATFYTFTGYLAIAIGVITLVGSLVAAGKLHRIISQKPQVWQAHSLVTVLSLLIVLCFIILGCVPGANAVMTFSMVTGVILFSAIFGLYFSIRVGGADMPITISLLNSLSGVAGAIAGMAIGNVLLVAVGGIVGASGLLLTQIMCKAMNRSLVSILFARSAKPSKYSHQPSVSTSNSIQTKKTLETSVNSTPKSQQKDKNPEEVLASAKRVIIVPGYGMALAQAQHQVKQLADLLTSRGTEVRFAIHPVAGRMPGHMNVLLAEANVSYDDLFQMEDINDDFAQVDAVVVVGANDVLNPAARDAEGTPIYGMPVLNVDQAPYVIICNYDLKPGYAGVENPLYSRQNNVALMLGDAKESLGKLVDQINKSWDKQPTEQPCRCAEPTLIDKNPAEKLAIAKKVIIVPGYGMALAQAQHQVKQLADLLTSRGTEVRFAIHPVAGRMPGHMNVLLAEANVSYDDLFQMEEINNDFKDVDAVIVIGANDVLNPAARDAEGTPIYGMPVLNVDQAPYVIICNYDLKPGYAGVDNPLYTKEEGVALMLGDAKESLKKLSDGINKSWNTTETKLCNEKIMKQETPAEKLAKANRVIIVPGYGMALAQAQHQVKQLADKLIARGANVRFAIHPVAGRMPGHMNVLLAEANVSYDDLFQMEEINNDFKDVDAVIVIGANDVLNPAARDAEGTPIYGMPVLNVDQAPYVIICNYDLKPGYAGVDNPLYTKEEGVALMLGDAKESLNKLMSELI